LRYIYQISGYSFAEELCRREVTWSICGRGSLWVMFFWAPRAAVPNGQLTETRAEKSCRDILVLLCASALSSGLNLSPNCQVMVLIYSGGQDVLLLQPVRTTGLDRPSRTTYCRFSHPPRFLERFSPKWRFPRARNWLFPSPRTTGRPIVHTSLPLMLKHWLDSYGDQTIRGEPGGAGGFGPGGG